MSERRAVPLCPEFEESLSFQSYGSPVRIDGVWIHPLSKLRSSNGSFMEVLRLDSKGIEGLPTTMDLKQVNVSWAEPGRLNAFHIHVRERQDEVWTVVGGSLLVWLVDMRQASSTARFRRSIVLSAEQPVLLHIPSGVAHGYKAGPQGATLLYFMSAQFNPADPNEGRIPWDRFGKEIWKDDQG